MWAFCNTSGFHVEKSDCSCGLNSILKKFIDQCWVVKKMSKNKVQYFPYCFSELEQQNPYLNPHVIGFIFKYCLIEEHPFNFVICSSIFCLGSFENTAWNDSFKWSVIDQIF